MSDSPLLRTAETLNKEAVAWMNAYGDVITAEQRHICSTARAEHFCIPLFTRMHQPCVCAEVLRHEIRLGNGDIRWCDRCERPIK